jgi:hypothetical protein
MKIWSHFDSNFIQDRLEYNRSIHDNDFLFSQFHWIILLKAIVNEIFLLTIILWLLYFPVTNFFSIYLYLILSIVLVALVVCFSFMLYQLSFIIVNKNEIIIYKQLSIFRRDIDIIHIHINNIRSVEISSSGLLCTFLKFGTINIYLDNEHSFEIATIPNIQKQQELIRQYIYQK